MAEDSTLDTKIWKSTVKNELLTRPVSSSIPIPLALPGVVVGVVTVPAPPVPDLLTALHLTTIK